MIKQYQYQGGKMKTKVFPHGIVGEENDTFYRYVHVHVS
jgi:hypothetical protein